MRVDHHILNRLVTKLEILLDRDRVLDADKDDGGSREQGEGQESPGDAKHGLVLHAEVVESPEDGSTGTLNSLVEAGKVGSLAAGVRKGAHVPANQLVSYINVILMW